MKISLDPMLESEIIDNIPINNTDSPILINQSNVGSQIIEPDIITPITQGTLGYTINGVPLTQQQMSEASTAQLVEQLINENTPLLGNQNSSVPSETTSPNVTPSATTEETKTYVSGGTAPDTSIIVNKPKTKYLIYGLAGVVGLYIVYKVFFNKKS